jgi:starvation-inducible DNA-binding protein
MTQTATRTHQRETRHDLPAKNRAAVNEMLNQHLANLSDLFTQTKFAHWNVKGRNFYSLHKLFDELAQLVEGSVDEVAERITALGGVAKGTARMAAENSQLDEFPTDDFGSDAVVANLADRYSTTAKSVRAGIDEAEELEDMGTSDLLTGIVQMLDKSLYFLESHLQKG